MAVRLRLLIRRNNVAIEAIALLNSGYEAPTPQLLIPINLARSLDLWPPQNALDVVLDTAGGPLRAWLYPKAAKVKIVAPDVESKEVEVDIIVSPLAEEPLISDMLAEELEIAVESFGRGLWRFRWEPKEKARKSAR